MSCFYLFTRAVENQCWLQGSSLFSGQKWVLTTGKWPFQDFSFSERIKKKQNTIFLRPLSLKTDMIAIPGNPPAWELSRELDLFHLSSFRFLTFYLSYRWVGWSGQVAVFLELIAFEQLKRIWDRFDRILLLSTHSTSQKY